MKTTNMTPPQLAIIARQKIARDLEKRLLVLIKDNPGMSVYDLSKRIKRDPSTIHSAVRRLVSEQLVTARTVLRKEGRLKRVYPQEFKFDDFCEVTLPKQVVHIGNPTWQDAYIYQLNSQSIGIAGEPIPDWEVHAKPIVQKTEHMQDGSIKVRLPDKVCNFYDLSRKETLLAYINNKALLTITGSFV
jgi:DNA-binding Lrp family transcriptional regulator